MSARFDLVPLAWLKAHEEHVEDRVRELTERFRRSGCVDYAVVADRATGTVIDGHHRLESLRRLGAALAPAVLVDYMDPSITVRSWRADEKAPEKSEVVARAAAGRLYPPKTTRHDFVRVLDPVDVPLAQLGAPIQREAR
ncbi:MAG TPA: ParB N-terminal domain-containing protein [Candidatus Thermoplasmatota archaeon]|nr:ParB N-terminal domain-containing protein [Candidatus Thermoplasmatota archaeon]